ncbi:alpha-(1,3)-fucosyltransferase C-like [Bombyx mandarina]|uniref:Fucosyltransferase n=1 Tax=Bombyx mandarina TaxID=7092 RepID=A0A6J2JCI0_BOMMA|nr:alpha-(1,3)-fucosyltransferase C-like [Bombyx mandarina]
MRNILNKKTFFLFLFFVVILLLFLKTFKDVTIHEQFLNGYKIITENDEIKNIEVVTTPQATRKQETTEPNEAPKLKYILQWTSAQGVPFAYMGKGQEGFIQRKCPHTNCFVTADRNLLGDYTKFDVIAFAGPDVVRMSEKTLPEKRSPHQKYAFATIESSDNYPVCSNRFDGYFNWTWTFRLDSEVRWGYFNVKDKNENVIGPNKIMHWMKIEDMEPVSEDFKIQLKSKSKAAAWFVSNCYTRSRREDFANELQVELKKYNLELDIYGRCGNLKCSRDTEEACDEMIREKYYFYLSFENSFGEDYVTEKLLHALEFDAVPVVYGGANYTRFMPEGIYLNARELGAAALAEKMAYLIKTPDRYIDMFKWKNHYTYFRKFRRVDTDEYCLFCTILNQEDKVKSISVYENFRKWWDPPNRC